MIKNEDGSVDIYFGSSAPLGKEENWIYTPTRKSWFAFFRADGPGRALQDKVWVLPNIEKISSLKQAQQ